jgi:ParB family chromosome partitioning protein
MESSFGKGIESLIPKRNIKLNIDPKRKKDAIFYIEIDKIKPNPSQPRKDFDDQGLKNLAQSIRDYGILQPLVVSRLQREGRIEYRLIAGERRFVSARMAGLMQVPVIVKEPTEREELEMSMIENIQRIDLNPIEKAEAFQRLYEEFGLTQKEIARVCGMSREAVANSLRILKLPKRIKDGIREKKITEGHAKAIMAVKDSDKQEALFGKILKDGLSVREAEIMAQRLNLIPVESKKIPSGLREEIKELEERFKKTFSVNGLKMSIASGCPKLVIPFKNKKEAEKFLAEFKTKS